MTAQESTFNWRSQVFPKRDNLPLDLTTYDYLKAAAIILTVVDHVGWLLFPDIEWFRAVGRLCVPIWFFLIGYARTRDVPGRWMAAAVILLVSSLLVGLPPLPLSIIMTMAFIRLSLDPLWRWLRRHPYYFWWVFLLLVFASLPAGLAVEYGTMGYVLAFFGYVVRNRAEAQDHFGSGIVAQIGAGALASFTVLSAMNFGFSPLPAMLMGAGMLGLYFILSDFQGRTLPGTAGDAQASLIRFLGRYTLEIYVIHLLILKAVFGLDLLARNILQNS